MPNPINGNIKRLAQRFVELVLQAQAIFEVNKLVRDEPELSHTLRQKQDQLPSSWQPW